MEKENCDNYCSHGGVCVLDKGHKGEHDSRYCQWSDKESLSKEKADEVLIGKYPEDKGIKAIAKMT